MKRVPFCLFVILSFFTEKSAFSAPRPCQLGVVIEGLPQDSAELPTLASRCTPPLITYFIQWSAELSGKEKQKLIDSLATVARYDAVPVLTWEPMEILSTGERAIPLTEIKEGRYNRYIESVTKVLATHPQGVILRLAHEMNLKRYHWGIPSEKDFTSKRAPETYRELFRHIARIVRAHDPERRIKIAFNPNHESDPYPSKEADSLWNQFDQYYPGDDYVDVLGLDGYNWGTTLSSGSWRSSPKTPEELYSEPFSKLRAVSSRKLPLYIFEAASVGSDEEKRLWAEKLVEYSRQEGLAGTSWFQVNKERNWKVEIP